MHQRARRGRQIGILPFLMIAGMVWLMAAACQAAVEVIEPLELSGEIVEAEDISAVAVLSQDRLVIAADERDKVQILRRVDTSRYAVEHTFDLVKGKKEADFEGAAVTDAEVYVVGSHSRKRKRVKDDKKQKKNLKRLATVEAEPSRDVLLRFAIEGGELGAVEEIEVRALIDGDDVLSPFETTPSKENGIDIEGLAVRGGDIYVGFRGPVLRDNFVPILRFDAEDTADHEVLFVQLEGGGVRGMSEVSDGLLLLSGAVGDARLEQALYFWDGRTCVPGKDVAEPCTLQRLGEVPLPSGQPGAKAEGVAVLAESDTDYELVVVYDSATNGAPMRLRVDKP